MNTRLQEKLGEQMEDTYHRLGLAGLTLATDEGLLLASCGQEIDMEYMAAISPLARTSTQKVQELTEALRQKGLRFSILGLRLKEQSLFLCAAGRDEQIHSPELKPLLRGLAQIVTTVAA